MTPSFWKGKRVYVTGHTGFKGSWMVMVLKNAGAIVGGYSIDIPTDPSAFVSCRVAELLEKDDRGDIADVQKFKSALLAFKPEILFHMAAQPLVRLSYREPFETYQTNVMGTLSVLLAANECPSLSTIVNITTDKCYENKEINYGYRETDPVGGHDPYSSSKACAEILSASIRDSFLTKNHKKMATARAGNVIGGGDWAEDRIVPDFIRAYQNRKQIQIRNPQAIRPWQHVLEPVHGYCLLAEKLYADEKLSGPWNFGPEDKDCRNVDFIVTTLHQLIPDHAGIDRVGNSGQPHEATFLKLDCTKAKNFLQGHPKWGAEEALAFTADWYKSSLHGDDMRKKSMEQIHAYQDSK